MITLALPWPSRTLHPNARVHWAVKAKAAKKARDEAAWVARSYGLRRLIFRDISALKVTAIFSPPDKRPRDLDGLLSSMKPAFDGIADVTGVDDSKWTFGAPRKEAPVKGGLVTIQIDEAT